MSMKTDFRCGVYFEVESSGKTFHSMKDWGLRCVNTDRIGDPIQNTKYISVLGLNKKLDLTEAVTGRPTYSHREIKIVLAGINKETDWESIISTFRNAIDGRVCKITFDNDPAYYWQGRVHVVDFSSIMRLGTFTVSIPEADPYKYNMESSAEPWKWNPFNFETGVITNADAEHIVGSGAVVIPSGHMYVSPEFVVSNLSSSSFTVEFNGKTYELKLGSNRIPPILINGDEEVTLKFTGTADVLIVYRGGSL